MNKKEANNNYEKPKDKVVEESGDGGDWADLMAEEERVVEPISSRDTRRKDSWASEMNNFEVCSVLTFRLLDLNLAVF